MSDNFTLRTSLAFLVYMNDTTAKEEREIITHSAMPNAKGRRPTSFMLFIDIPEPMKKSDALSPCFAPETVPAESLSGMSSHVLASIAAMKRNINQGTDIFLPFFPLCPIMMEKAG